MYIFLMVLSCFNLELLNRDKSQGDQSLIFKIKEAINKGNTELVKKFLIENKDIDQKDLDIFLISASMENELAILKILIEKGANVNTVDIMGCTPLIFASYQGVNECVKLLIDQGAEVNHVSKKGGITSLLAASKRGYWRIVLTLLAAKAEVNVCDDQGLTPLMWAALGGHKKAVEALLENGANSRILTKNRVEISEGVFVDGGIGVFEIATSFDRKNILEIFKNRGIEKRSEEPKSYAQELSLKNFITAGQVVYSVTESTKLDQKKTSLSDSVIAPSAKVYTVNKLTKEDRVLMDIILNCESGNLSNLRMLLKNKVDLNFIFENKTPLICASEQGHEKVVIFLIKNGAKVDYTNSDGWTAIMSASRREKLEVLNILLFSTNAEAFTTQDIKLKDNKVIYKGATALMIAAKEGKAKSVTALLHFGANVNQTDSNGFSALIFACFYEREAVVKCLLASKKIDLEISSRNENNLLIDGYTVAKDTTAMSATLGRDNENIFKLLRIAKAELPKFKTVVLNKSLSNPVLPIQKSDSAPSKSTKNYLNDKLSKIPLKEDEKKAGDEKAGDKLSAIPLKVDEKKADEKKENDQLSEIPLKVDEKKEGDEKEDDKSDNDWMSFETLEYFSNEVMGMKIICNEE